MKPTICVDFDGVIHDRAHPVPGFKMGPPMAGAKDALQILEAVGFHIVVLTANETPHIVEWLRYYRFRPYEVTNAKPPALLYIDDRGLRFESWDRTLQAIADLGLARKVNRT